jgi:hypothetical protein
MTQQQQALEALEAAKLATTIGSQLKAVDQLSFRDSSSMPANRLNINEFIECVKNPNARVANKFQQVPHGFAPPPPEEQIQSMVPDITPSFQPQVQQVYIPPKVEQQQQPQVQQVDVNNRKNNLQVQNESETQKDIADIKKSVEQINKNLIRLIDIIRNKK